MVTRFKGTPTLEEGMYSFLEQLREYDPRFAEFPVPEAWNLVLRVHGGQLRKNGGSVAINHLAGSAIGLADYITRWASQDPPHYGSQFPTEKWALTIASTLLHDMEEDADPNLVPQGWEYVFLQEFGHETSREIYPGIRKFSKPNWQELDLPPYYSVTRKRLEADRLGIQQIVGSGDMALLFIKFQERLQNMSDPTYDDDQKMFFGAYKTRANLLPLATEHSAYYNLHLSSAVLNIGVPERLEDLERLLKPLTV